MASLARPLLAAFSLSRQVSKSSTFGNFRLNFKSFVQLLVGKGHIGCIDKGEIDFVKQSHKPGEVLQG